MNTHPSPIWTASLVCAACSCTVVILASCSEAPTRPSVASTDVRGKGVAPGPQNTALAAPVDASTPAPTLRPGDLAPPLAVSKWLRGSPEDLRKKPFYVVDFWSPSSPVAARSMPALAAMTERYRSKAGFVAVAIWEDKPAQVTSYLAKNGFARGCGVAIDEHLGVDRGTSATAWLQAAGMGAPRFVPTAFVVDRAGRIQWIGSTFDLPNVLDEVLAPNWDVNAFAKMFASQQARMNKQYAQLHDPVFQQLMAARASMQQKDYRQTIRQIDALLNLKSPKVQSAVSFAIPMKLYSYRQLGDMPGYYAASEKASEVWSTNPHIQNLLAWDIVDPASRLSQKRYDLALTYAQRAVALTDRKNPNLLDTLAWAYWDNGQKPEARATESAALALAKAADRPEMQMTLQRFTAP